MPTKTAATPDQVCVGIRIQTIDIVQPPGICMPPVADIDVDHAIVTAALPAKSSAEMPKNARSSAREKTMCQEILKQAVRIDAIRANRAAMEFRGLPPLARDQLVKELGDKITVQTGDWNCVNMITPNHQKKPFDDVRVRRALTLAIDQWHGADALAKIANVRTVGGIVFPGSPLAATKEELQKIVGYWPDIEKSRAESRRLLKEAGVPEGFQFTFTNRGVPMPYEPLGVWLIDQWRRVGLNVQQQVIEPAAYFGTIRKGDAQVFMDFQCGYIVEPDLDMYKFLSSDRNPANYGRYKDPVLDALYDKQSRTIDFEERGQIVQQFEKRLLDEEAHYLMTLQWHRIVPYNAKVRGWTVTPSLGCACSGCRVRATRTSSTATGTQPAC